MILHCFPPTRMGTTDKSNKKKPQLQQDGTQYSQRFNKMFPVGFEKLFSRVPQFTLQQRIKLPFIRPDGEADLGKSQVRVPVDTFFIHGFLKSRVGGLHGTHSFFSAKKATDNDILQLTMATKDASRSRFFRFFYLFMHFLQL